MTPAGTVKSAGNTMANLSHFITYLRSRGLPHRDGLQLRQFVLRVFPAGLFHTCTLDRPRLQVTSLSKNFSVLSHSQTT